MRCDDAHGAKGGSNKNITPVKLPAAPFLLVLLLFKLLSCSTYTKLERLRQVQEYVEISLPDSEDYAPPVSLEPRDSASGDTLKVKDLYGNDVFVMKAVMDESGEMVASDELQAAVVTARFRNVAERGGRIELRFQIVVPEHMQDSRWQLRLHPDMFILKDSIALEDVIITGDAYRDMQLRGYERYERFVSRIISDSTRFIDYGLLEIFLKRNIPELYAFKTDSSIVSESEFNSRFGVSEREAVEHYTRHMAKRLNERRKSRREEMFGRYVPVPIASEGVRLDTVMRTDSGSFVYEYLQTVKMRPGLRKIDIVLSGEIYEQDKALYLIPPSSPLTFYVSSVSAFVDDRKRYLSKVVSRNASFSDECNIDFELGASDIRLDLGDNRTEIEAVKQTVRTLLGNEHYDLDSVTVAASASPEGSRKANAALSYRRSMEAARYFEDFIEEYKDSLTAEQAYVIDISDDMSETAVRRAEMDFQEIRFLPASAGEDWAGLDALVLADTVMTEQQKYRYFHSETLASDPDERESLLRKEDFYAHLRLNLYPSLRRVKFRFAMSRKDMIKDTVMTTVLDSSYMRGVQHLKDHEYEDAIEILAPYADYNAAVAYVALDRNHSARMILSDMPRTAAVNYMLALIYAREGNDEKAVEHYLHSCDQDRSFVSRGNLDPEISALIKRYNLLLLN